MLPHDRQESLGDLEFPRASLAFSKPSWRLLTCSPASRRRARTRGFAARAFAGYAFVEGATYLRRGTGTVKQTHFFWNSSHLPPPCVGPPFDLVPHPSQRGRDRPSASQRCLRDPTAEPCAEPDEGEARRADPDEDEAEGHQHVGDPVGDQPGGHRRQSSGSPIQPRAGHFVSETRLAPYTSSQEDVPTGGSMRAIWLRNAAGPNGFGSTGPGASRPSRTPEMNNTGGGVLRDAR